MGYQVGAIKDSLINLMAGFGVPGRDKAATGASFWNYHPLTQFELESAYRSNWMARKVIDIPAQDATRAWRAWQADTNQIEKLEEEEVRLDIQVVLKNALIMARLYGGAAIVMGVKQGKADKPLDLESVGKGDLQFVVPVSRWSLGYGPIITDVMDPYYGKPEFFTRNVDTQRALGADQFKIHPSRVIMLRGMQVPDPVQSGELWGDSILQNVQDAIQSATLVTQSIATLVTESKFDIVKIPDLSQNIASAEYQNRLTARFVYANSVKSVINTLLLDKEEEWERINANFTQLPDVLQMYLLIASGAADIPATRMLGQSPAGLQSTGESDVRNYYDRVNSDQTNVLSPALAALDDVLIRSALGKRDPSLYYIWNPLWQIPAAEKAAIAKQKAEVASSDAMAGLIDLEALRIGRQNQLIEDGTYPGLEQALEEQEQLDLESMESPEEQEKKAEAEMRKQQLAGQAGSVPGGPGQKPGGPPKGNGGGSPFQKKDARPTNAGRLKLRTRDYRRVHDFDPDQPRDPQGQWTSGGGFSSAPAEQRVTYRANRDRIGTYDPRFFRHEAHFEEWEGKPVDMEKDRLIPTAPHQGDLPGAMPADDVIYRGMSAAEFDAIAARGEVRGLGEYNIGKEQEGLTYFSNDPSMAASYAHSFAPSKFKADWDRPAYVVAVRRPAAERIRRVLGTGEDEIGVVGGISADDIVDVFRGNVIAHQPAYKGRGVTMHASATLHWTKLARRRKAIGDEFREENVERGRGEQGGQFVSKGMGGGPTAEEEGGAAAPAESEVLTSEAKGEKKTDITQNMGADYEPKDKQVQPMNDVDQLYEACKKAEPGFMSTVEEFAASVGGTVMYPPASSAEPGSRTMKSRASTNRKMNDEEEGQAERIKDVLRATIAFDDVVTTRSALAEFVSTHDVVRVKDRFDTPHPGGYRDLLVNFRTEDGIITELQFNTHALLEKKFGTGHTYYEERRKLVAKANKTPEELDRIDELEDLMEEGYNEGYEECGDGCGWKKNC